MISEMKPSFRLISRLNTTEEIINLKIVQCKLFKRKEKRGEEWSI